MAFSASVYLRDLWWSYSSYRIVVGRFTDETTKRYALDRNFF